MNNSLKIEEVGSNIKAILDIKDEYTNRFISITRERIKEGYQSIYDNVKENNTTPKLILKEFQDKLKLVPVWSEKMIEDEFNRIKIISKCDYLEELIEALFSSYSQMFMIVNNKKFDNPVKIPSHHYVLHNCYIEIARELWRKPQLFYHRYDNQKRQLLNDELNKLIDNSINNSIKKLIPFKELLNNYLDKTNTTIEELDSLKISSNEVHEEEQEVDEEEQEVDEEEEISDNYEIIDKNELEESINNTENKIIENEDKEELEELEGLVEDANVETVENVIEEPMKNLVEEQLDDTENINNNVDITKTLDISLENNETLNEFTNDENELEEDNIEEEFTLDENNDDQEDNSDNDDSDNNDDETGIEGDIENSDNTDNQEDTDELIEGFGNEKENNEKNTVNNDYYNNEETNNQEVKINEGVLNDNIKEENIKEENIIEENIIEENIKEVKILSKKDKKHNNEKKIARYLGVNVSVNEFKNNKDKIKKMLLHKSIANV